MTVVGELHSYQHEVKGLPLVQAFLDRITSEKKNNALYVKFRPIGFRSVFFVMEGINYVEFVRFNANSANNITFADKLELFLLISVL